MSGLAWVLWLLLGAAVMTLSVQHYRRREPPGRGRVLLAVLRAAAVALALLLLFDPDLPAGSPAGMRGTQVLLDASLSMRVGDGVWEEAVGEARSRAGDRPVLLFGDRSRPVAPGSLPDSAPGDARSRLLPALQAAAEAGARSVVVVTDGGLEDADAVARWAPRLGLGIEMVDVGVDVPNQSMVEASAPQWVDAGEPVPLDFAVAGSAGDSVAVVVRRDGRVIGRTVMASPSAGLLAAGRLELQLEPAAGDDAWVRLEVALETGDAVPDDDQRTVYVQVGEEPAGIALVSFRPDWEPRFLAPVLERSLGLPLRAWLRAATGRYVELGAGMDAGVRVEEADVQRAVERAQLVVLHGLGVDAPAWAHEAARSSSRILIFPAADASGLDLPVDVGVETQGDFFPSGSIPASPVTPLLADLDVAGARPLTGLRTAELPQGAWTPLTVTRGRQGAVLPVMAAGGAGGGAGGRRWAVSLGSGYWQWAFRGGAERQLYARFWSALAGWLAQDQGVTARQPVRPAEMTLPRGMAVPWVTSAVSDSVHVVIMDGSGATVMDTVAAGARSDTVFTAALEPGSYRYRARAFTGDNVLDGQGVVTIERYSPELARPRIDGARLEAGAEPVRGGGIARRGTPLHATAYPYVLIVLLLAAEWILRRRWGLR